MEPKKEEPYLAEGATEVPWTDDELKAHLAAQSSDKVPQGFDNMLSRLARVEALCEASAEGRQIICARVARVENVLGLKGSS